MASKYQLPSDGYDRQARSGVIRSDGKWIACAADSKDWDEYEAWLKEDPEKNRPDPYRSPEDGGVVIKLEKDQVPVGVMLNSLLPPEEPKPAPAQQAPAAHQEHQQHRERGRHEERS
jgi:hypothetical protein